MIRLLLHDEAQLRKGDVSVVLRFYVDATWMTRQSQRFAQLEYT